MVGESCLELSWSCLFAEQNAFCLQLIGVDFVDSGHAADRSGFGWCLRAPSLLRSCGSSLLLTEVVGLAADKRDVGFASSAAALAQNGASMLVPMLFLFLHLIAVVQLESSGMPRCVLCSTSLFLVCSADGLIMDLLGVYSDMASQSDAEGPYELSNTRPIGGFHWLICEVYVPVPNR
ncbi:hypothetical protein U1Q18_032932 [Sarracenia purpurea var. burkii]